MPPSAAHLTWLREHTSNPGDRCILWPFYVSERGYGVVYARSAGIKSTRAHVVALTLRVPPPSASARALHSCDTPACVNPNHLRWGTQAENVMDRQIRNRQARGSKVRTTVLDEARVRSIRVRHARGEPGNAIARTMGVSKGTVYSIVKRRTWKYVD